MVTPGESSSSDTSIPVAKNENTPFFVVTCETPKKDKAQETNEDCLETGDEQEFAPQNGSTPVKEKSNNNLVLAIPGCGDIEQDGAGLSPRITSSLAIPSVFGGSKGLSDTHSRDIESVCTAHSDVTGIKIEPGSCWWMHPKVKQNWRVFLAAFGLLSVGCILITLGILGAVLPHLGLQSYVFFIGGLLCFIPGAYHVVFVYCAVKGRSGYNLSQLPLFR